MTPENIWILGITQESATLEYYLVFYHDIHVLLDRFMENAQHVRYLPYTDFDEIKEIGAGGYGTVHTAKYKNYSAEEDILIPELVVLKCVHNFENMPDLLINEVSNLFEIN